MSDNENKAKGLIYWILNSIIILSFLLLVNWFWASIFPVALWEYWTFDPLKITDALVKSTPIFLWGGAITAIAGCFMYFRQGILDRSEDILKEGFVTSLIAGVFEELIFRWILFYSAMIAVQFSNFLFFGFISTYLELPRLFYSYIAAPVLNFLSFYNLNWLLLDKGWIIGAAAISANAKFRNEHAYLGILGYFNSWFIGFFLFWIMMNNGLPAAILIHFLYDLIIFVVIYIHVKFRETL